jgi:hypothetical protein
MTERDPTALCQSESGDNTARPLRLVMSARPGVWGKDKK